MYIHEYQQYMVTPTLIELNLDELHHYPFIISMKSYNGSCNTIDDPFGRIWVPNKMEGISLTVFKMIRGINQSQILPKHISCESKCEFNVTKCNSRQKMEQ